MQLWVTSSESAWQHECECGGLCVRLCCGGSKPSIGLVQAGHGNQAQLRPFYTVNWQMSNRARYLSRFSLPTVTVHLQAALEPTSTPASLILMPCLTQLVSYPLSLMPALFLLLASHLWLSILMYGREFPEYKLQWIWNHLLSITVLMDLYLHFERM